MLVQVAGNKLAAFEYCRDPGGRQSNKALALAANPLLDCVVFLQDEGYQVG